MPKGFKGTLPERFWAKVAKGHGDACWLWHGCLNGDGYGRFWDGRRLESAHRIAWRLAHGEIVEGLRVLHHCDQPRCCRPSHLFLGTQQDNVADMFAKRRNGSLTKPERVARGERSGASKLTSDDVLLIRAECASGRSQSKVGTCFGVSQGTVGRIVRREMWRHIP